MNGLPSSIRPVLRPFARRLVLGQFLEIWPRWAAAGFLLAGLVTLICRLFFPDAGDLLPWIWLSPAFSLFPAIIICIKRAYRHDEIGKAGCNEMGG